MWDLLKLGKFKNHWWIILMEIGRKYGSILPFYLSINIWLQCANLHCNNSRTIAEQTELRWRTCAAAKTAVMLAQFWFCSSTSSSPTSRPCWISSGTSLARLWQWSWNSCWRTWAWSLRCSQEYSTTLSLEGPGSFGTSLGQWRLVLPLLVCMQCWVIVCGVFGQTHQKP